MSTPIYDELLAKSSPAWAALIMPNPVDSPTREPWPLEGTRITFKPETKWRTFLRRLGWWKP